MENAQTSTNSDSSKKHGFFREVLSYGFLALVIVLPIRMWVAQPFVVNGSSMDETFKDGEYLIVDELSYRFKEPERGDVLIFKYPQDPSKYFIKRLIGLPGETVVVKGNKVTIINRENPSGIVLSEPYARSRTFGDVRTVLRADEYFVMGDNRVVSSDSRVWGALPKSDIVGRPIVRLLPLGGIGLWPGKFASTTLEARD